MNAFQARTLSIITKLESKKEYEEMVPVYTRSALEDINKRIEYSASIGQSELKVETIDYPNLNKEAFKCIKAELKKEGFKVSFKTFKENYGTCILVSKGIIIKW